MALRPMRPDDWHEVADLICVSMNHWYRAHAMGPIFPTGPAGPMAVIRTYEALDPGCCVLAEQPQTRRVMGSCFYHPRETHVSLGMMAAHPNYFGLGVGRRLVKFITDVADASGLPTRLVSSAVNLDSYSLYSRGGFVPRALFQDVVLKIAESGLPPLPGHLAAPGLLRDAAPDDADAMGRVEQHVGGIRRGKDYRFFIDRPADGWHVSVLERDGALDGFLVSRRTGESCSVGPGVAKDVRAAASLLHRELDRLRGTTPLVLVPADEPDLVGQLYTWGGKNVELHLLQARGAFTPPTGVVFPTFMPETG